MKKRFDQIEKYLKKHHRKKLFHGILCILALLIFSGVFYVMKHPAIAMQAGAVSETNENPEITEAYSAGNGTESPELAFSDGEGTEEGSANLEEHTQTTESTQEPQPASDSVSEKDSGTESDTKNNTAGDTTAENTSDAKENGEAADSSDNTQGDETASEKEIQDSQNTSDTETEKNGNADTETGDKSAFTDGSENTEEEKESKEDSEDKDKALEEVLDKLGKADPSDVAGAIEISYLEGLQLKTEDGSNAAADELTESEKSSFEGNSGRESSSSEEATENSIPESSRIRQSDEIPAEAAALSLNEEEVLAAGDSQSGIDLSKYISNITLQYSTATDADQKDIWVTWTSGSSESIPGDAKLRMNVNYNQIELTDVQANGYKLYFTAPEFMKKISTLGVITDMGGVHIGDISVEGRQITITLDQEWTNAEIDAKGDTAYISNGYFYVNGEVDLTAAEKNPQGTWIYGDVTISVHFSDSLVVQYGDVSVDKSVNPVVIEDGNGNLFLKYTLTVTAGEDAIPGVYVTDTLEPHKDIDEAGYVGISSTSYTLSASETGLNPFEKSSYTEYQPGNITLETSGSKNSFIWQIGDMKAKEVRTLVYYVKLEDSFVGGTSPNTVSNTAVVYASSGSTSVEKDNDTVNYKATAKVGLSKWFSRLDEDSTGGYLVTYRFLVKGDDANSYTLKNVVLKDSFTFNKTVTGKNQNFSIVENSFEYYKGDSVNESNKLPDTSNFTPVLDKDADNNQLFSMTVGSLKPGETYTVTYQVKIDPGVMAEIGNQMDADLVNTIKSYASDDTEFKNEIGTASATVDITPKKWARKIVGSQMRDSKIVETADTVSKTGLEHATTFWNLTGSTVTQTNDPGTFTVPSGGVQYHVLVNEDGRWQVSAANFVDTLSSDYVQYSGWVKISVYHTDADGYQSTTNLTDSAALEQVEGLTPVRYIWAKVDGLQSFSFSPKDLGVDDIGSGQNAHKHGYLLEYYVAPKDSSKIGSLQLGNTFSMSGTVIGPNGNTHTLGTTMVSTKSTIVGSSSMNATKSSWYYDASGTAPDGTTVSNGLLYWVIEVKADGTNNGVLPAGMTIVDRPKSGEYRDTAGTIKNSRHHIVGAWLYKGSSGKDFTQYASLSSLNQAYSYMGLNFLDSVWTPAAATTTETLGSNFTWSIEWSKTEEGRVGKLKVTQDYALGDGNSLYVVIASQPDNNPVEGKRSMGTYNNRVYTNSDESSQNEILKDSASQTVYGTDGIMKEAEQVFTWNETKKAFSLISGTSAEEKAKTKIVTDHLKGSGTYIAWNAKINYEGLLSGDYTLEDEIPDGLELAYVRVKWMGAGQLQNPAPVSSALNLDGGWTQNSITFGLDEEVSSYTTYYYTNANDPQKVKWGISGLKAYDSSKSYSRLDSYSVDFQIVCRVTDERVLLAGIKKVFNNTVNLYNEAGRLIDTDSSAVTVQKETINKEKGTAEGSRITYIITVNALAEDLLENGNTITLIDKMSDNLRAETDTIEVKDLDTGQTLSSSEYTVGQDGQTLNIVLPDSRALEVTYSAIVRAAPGETVSGITNTAYWEGYTSFDGGETQIANFKYTAGGSIELASHPTVTIKKVDGANTGKTLSGAQFKLEEVGTFTLNGNQTVYTPATANLSWTGTSDSNGIWKIDDSHLAYNTLYRLEETGAPKGYVLETTPKYFIIAKAEGTGEDAVYPAFDSKMPTLADKGDGVVDIWYLGYEYEYRMNNFMGEVKVQKTFVNAGGETLNTPLSGTYYFAIYDTENPTVETTPIAKDYIRYRQDGSHDRTAVTFQDLPLGKTYYVYELDDSGAPITSTTTRNSVGGIPFYTSYSGNVVTIGTDGTVTYGDTGGSAVVVSNRMGYEALPVTGGEGIQRFIYGGALLMIASLFLLYKRNISGQS